MALNHLLDNTGYFPGVCKYGQFTSGHIGHTKMPLFELSM
jgi:hypothetical protein